MWEEMRFIYGHICDSHQQIDSYVHSLCNFCIDPHHYKQDFFFYKSGHNLADLKPDSLQIHLQMYKNDIALQSYMPQDSQNICPSIHMDRIGSNFILFDLFFVFSF